MHHLHIAQWQGGVLASLFGSFCGTLGGQLRICSLTYAGRVACLLQALGWTFWLSGQALGQVAILLAPVTVAACVTFCGSLLWNALLAPFVLRERLTRSHALGIALLSLGGVIVTMASSHTDQEYTLAELRRLLRRPVFLSAAAASLAAAAALAVAAYRRSVLDVYSFAYLFALCGSTDLLVTKFTLQLIRLSVVAWDKTEPLPSRTALSFCTALMMLLHVATFCFQVGSAYYRQALQSIPLFLGSGAMMQVSLCGIFFGEFRDFSSSQSAAFLSGFTLVIVGMAVTSMAVTPQPVPLDSPTSLPAFQPPTASREVAAGQLPIISSGLLEQRSSSLSSSDLFMMSEIQRSAMCFGGRYGTGKASVGLHRKFESAPLFQRPLLLSTTSPLGDHLSNLAPRALVRPLNNGVAAGQASSSSAGQCREEGRGTPGFTRSNVF